MMITRNKRVNEKRLDKNTYLVKEGDTIFVKYHGNSVMIIDNKSITITDGGYGYSISLKKRLNDWSRTISTHSIHIFTEKKQDYILIDCVKYQLGSQFTIVDNPTIDDAQYWFEKLNSNVDYVRHIMPMYNQDCNAALMVACDKVLEAN